MAQVKIELPSVLARIVDGTREVLVDGDTVESCLEALFRVHPQLRIHVFDETGAFRQHVLCFHNDTNTRWHDGVSKKTLDGDRIVIMQAVSGG